MLPASPILCSAPDGASYYPDSDKVLVRGLDTLGQISSREYFDGEPDPSRISELAKQRTTSSR